MRSIAVCFSDSIYLECYLSISCEIISAAMITICIIQMIKRGPPRFLKRRTAILILIWLSNIFYFSFNIKRDHSTLYFFQALFDSLFQTCLIYYFGRKVSQGNQQNRILIMVLFGLLTTVNIFTFIYLLIESSRMSEVRMFKSFTLLRTFAFVTQMIFAIIANQLSQKVALTLQDSFLNSQIFLNSKRKLEQLKLLVLINVIGASILMCTNFLYYFSNSEYCRLVPHFGESDYNFSDTLEAIVHTSIKLITYFIPMGITLVIFNPKPQSRADTQVEDVEPLHSEYFDGLSLKTQSN